VAVDVIVRSDGAQFAWLVSQAAEHLTVKPDLTSGLAIRPLNSDADAEFDGTTVSIPPFGIRVFHLDQE